MKQLRSLSNCNKCPSMLAKEWKLIQKSSSFSKKQNFLKSILSLSLSQESPSSEYLIVLQEVINSSYEEIYNTLDEESLFNLKDFEEFEILANTYKNIFSIPMSKIYLKLYWMNSTIQEYSNIYLKKVLNFIELSQNIPIVCEFYLCMSDYISYNSDKSLGLNYALKAEKLLLAMTNEKKIDADEYLTLKTLTLYYKGFFQSEAGNYIEALSNIEDSLKKSVHLSNSKDLTDKI